jgi:hypothetical protein
MMSLWLVLILLRVLRSNIFKYHFSLAKLMKEKFTGRVCCQHTVCLPTPAPLSLLGWVVVTRTASRPIARANLAAMTTALPGVEAPARSSIALQLTQRCLGGSLSFARIPSS